MLAGERPSGLPEVEGERAERVGAVDLNAHRLAAQRTELQHCAGRQHHRTQKRASLNVQSFSKGRDHDTMQAGERVPPASNEAPAAEIVPGRNVTAATRTRETRRYESENMEHKLSVRAYGGIRRRADGSQQRTRSWRWKPCRERCEQGTKNTMSKSRNRPALARITRARALSCSAGMACRQPDPPTISTYWPYRLPKSRKNRSAAKPNPAEHDHNSRQTLARCA